MAELLLFEKVSIRVLGLNDDRDRPTPQQMGEVVLEVSQVLLVGLLQAGPIAEPTQQLLKVIEGILSELTARL